MKNSPDKGVCVRESLPDVSRTSKALQANLEATDQAFTIDTKYLPLAEVVEAYPGLLQQAEAFMCELNHPFKNWEYAVREMRRYALQTFAVYFGHPKGLEVVRIILGEWLDALSLSPDKSVQVSAVENIVTFCEKIVGEGKEKARPYGPVLSHACKRLLNLPDEQFFFLVSGYYPLRRIGRRLVDASGEHGLEGGVFNRLYRKTLVTAYQYWLDQADPLGWFHERLAVDEAQAQEVLQTVSHRELSGFLEELGRIEGNLDSEEELSQLLGLPDFAHIVKAYEQLPDRIEQLEPDPHEGAVKKLLCLLKILANRGLVSIHETLVGRLNRCLTEIIDDRKEEEIEHLLVKTFETMGRTVAAFPETALQALENIGAAIFQARDSDLYDRFLQHTIDLGFQCPDVRGTTSEWKVQVNRAHAPCIKAWLHLIEKSPKWSTRLLSALIVNLRLGGLYVRDTDLFQKEISRFLNSHIGPVYHLAKKLAKLFPVYFNEINAEGRIRDISTEVDELLNRKDALIHFFRKQSHVESNNLLLGFCLEIIDFWRTRDKEPLSLYVAPEVLEAVKQNGPYVDGPHEVIHELFGKMAIDDSRRLLDFDDTTLDDYFSGLSNKNELDKKRVRLLIVFLRLLHQKYNLDASRLEDLLRESRLNGLPRTDDLEKALQNDDPFDRLQAIVNHLKRLKEIILSPEAFKASEDIYRKRHIAADIPSMYGTYRERKFDALGLSFRLENVARVQFEDLVASVDLEHLTGATLARIVDCMHLLVQAMALDGIGVRPLREYLYLLTHAVEVGPFSLSQYLDIFRGFAEAEQQVLNTHFTIIHRENLARITRQLGPERLLPKYFIGADETDEDQIVNKVSEVFFRDVVTNAFGFQPLDALVSKVIHALLAQSEKTTHPGADQCLTYDRDCILSDIHHPVHGIKDPIYMGGKGYNLVRLASYGVPVPGGFIITTEVYRCLSLLLDRGGGGKELEGRIVSHLQKLETETGKSLGHPDKPLLLSVRSGAAISLPGMMNTFLNVGMSEPVVESLIAKTGNPWFAWDNYRRFLQSWGLCHDMDRDTFDTLMNEHKARCGVQRKRELTAEQMEAVTRAYRDVLAGEGFMPPDDYREQLFQAIWQAFCSWNSDRAKTYRDIMGISDDWGTAVIVQAMVFGNLSGQAGSGVVFTHNPEKSLDRVGLWGDYTTCGQGEAVVSGLARTHSISVEQKTEPGRGFDDALEAAFPETFDALLALAERLVYEKGWGAQEIEFTFEGPAREQLYILQSRDMVIHRMKSQPSFVPSTPLKAALLTKGIGVSGGALSGRVVFSLEDIRKWRNDDRETPLVLIRCDTVPDDIREISAADGLLTARGGATSHASIVAHQLGKTCVVGCSDLLVFEEKGRAQIRGKSLRCGDFLSMDGQSGSVYEGRHEAVRTGGQ